MIAVRGRVNTNDLVLFDSTYRQIHYQLRPPNSSGGSTLPITGWLQRRYLYPYLDELPPKEHFWEWLVTHPEISIVITEGGKKALCLLSQGCVAIALYGVDGGARAKDAFGNRCKPYLIPEPWWH
jgi:hypothetical protein